MILLAIVDLCTGLKWFVLPLNGLQSGCLLVDVFSKTDILGGGGGIAPVLGQERWLNPTTEEEVQALIVIQN